MKPARNCLKATRVLICLASLSLTQMSCTGPRPLRGGKAQTTHGPWGATQQSLAQGDNPAQSSRQDQETIVTRTYTLPAGSRIEQPSLLNTPSFQHSNTPCVSVTLSSPMPIVEREETRARSELGASQKDNAREMGAKLANLRGITWVGVGLFVFGIASVVWPPLKAIVGSITTSAAIIFGGLALLILPTLVVGNELLILGGVSLTAGAWFLAHRHGQLRGVLSSSGPAVSPNSSPSQSKI